MALEGCKTGKDTYFADFLKSECYDKAINSVKLFEDTVNFRSNIETIAKHLEGSCERVAAIIPDLKDQCMEIITLNPKSTASMPKAYYKQTEECIALLKDYPTKKDSNKLRLKIHPDIACNHLIRETKHTSDTGAIKSTYTYLEGYDDCQQEAKKKSGLYSGCLLEE